MAEKHPDTRFSAINDGDGTDSEINRKLTELLRANALKANREPSSTGETDAYRLKPDVYPFRVLKAGGFGLLQIAGFATLLVLWPIAGIYSFFYEKADNR